MYQILDRLKELLTKGTQGEWLLDDPIHNSIASKTQEEYVVECTGPSIFNGRNNAALIVALHNEAPKLIAYIEATQTLLEGVRNLRIDDIPMQKHFELLSAFDNKTKNL